MLAKQDSDGRAGNEYEKLKAYFMDVMYKIITTFNIYLPCGRTSGRKQ